MNPVPFRWKTTEKNMLKPKPRNRVSARIYYAILDARDSADDGMQHEDCGYCAGVPDLWRESLSGMELPHRAFHVAIEARARNDEDDVAFAVNVVAERHEPSWKSKPRRRRPVEFARRG